MILIISDEDFTTSYVVDWLIYYSKKNKVVNSIQTNFIDSWNINNENEFLKIDEIEVNDITKIWHRRGKFNFKILFKYNELNKYLKPEEKILLYAIESYLKNKIEYIGSYRNEIENNKIEVLIGAKDVGLIIPNTFITSNKKKLQKIFNKTKQVITKDLHHPVWFKIKNTQYSSVGTIQITQTMIDKCNDYFIPMFLQEKIEKKYEVRIFHYKDKLFPMAIFSQNDKKTALDYRNYNDEKPNRNVPIILPKEIETKIFNLTKALELNTCSIDFIVNTKNEYVFLEVNPMGQLDWLSKNCNYYIEKYIAEDLMA